MAVRLAHGPVGVLDTGNGELTVIPGTALSSAAWLRMGWLGESHRLVIIAGLTADSGFVHFGDWQPGETRLTLAPPSAMLATELPNDVP